MTERRLPALRSLSAKLFLATVLSLLCALIAYVAVDWAGTLIVNRFYMSAEAVALRKTGIYTTFNRFILANNAAGNDAEALQRFLEQEKYVSITVYSAEDLELPAIRHPGSQNPGVENYVLPSSGDVSGKLYPVRFADGIYYITITDNSRTREDAINRGMALIVGAVVLLLVLFWYTNHLTKRIIRLSEETATVGAGDLEGVITVDGVDEIAVLAEDIDSMRHAIIEQMGSEKRAWESNSELITAMSHDIRTPMTSLIGYLALLNSMGSLNDDEKKHYIERAYGKSLALKELTDELFKYFLVYGSSGLEFHREDFDAQMLLMQLLSEAEFDLTDVGMTVRREDRLLSGKMINTDAAMLKRVIDNLVSNVKKYADREKPVVILTEEKEGEIAVTVSNSISDRISGTESTRIGLRTCAKILEGLGGSFTAERKEDIFTAEFRLPA